MVFPESMGTLPVTEELGVDLVTPELVFTELLFVNDGVEMDDPVDAVA